MLGRLKQQSLPELSRWNSERQLKYPLQGLGKWFTAHIQEFTTIYPFIRYPRPFLSSLATPPHTHTIFTNVPSTITISCSNWWHCLLGTVELLGGGAWLVEVSH